MLRYILQGIGWEVGRTAAKEGIDHLREGQAKEAPSPKVPPSPKERARADARAAKEAARAARARRKAAKAEAKAKQKAAKAEAAAIDRELAALKKKLDD